MSNNHAAKGHNECPEEQLPQSKSPFGKMANGETLGRFVYRRDWIDDYGNLTPAAFAVQDLLNPERRGISLVRLDKISDDETLEWKDDFRKNSDFDFIQVARAKTFEIRNLQTEYGTRAFCVIDDAVCGFLAHALLRLEHRERWTKGGVRRTRESLLRISKMRGSSEDACNKATRPE